MTSNFQILISNEQSAVDVSEAELIRVATLTLESEGVVQAEISVALVDDPAIHRLNRDYLQHDYPTDVISFLLDSGDADPRGVTNSVGQGRRGFGKWLAGDVVLSGDTARRESQEYGWEPKSEVCLYLVHGLLHLCGYDDLTDDEQALMRSREREILRELGWEPKYAEE